MPEIVAVIDTGRELCRGVTLKRWEHICYLTKDEIFELGKRGLRELFDLLGREHTEAKWLKLRMKGLRRHYGLHEFDPWRNPHHADGDAGASQNLPESDTSSTSTLPHGTSSISGSRSPFSHSHRVTQAMSGGSLGGEACE